MFLLHRNQTGSNRTNQQLPVNVLQRGQIKYFSINYQQHKNFYDFFQEGVVDYFLQSILAGLFLMASIKFKVMLK